MHETGTNNRKMNCCNHIIAFDVVAAVFCPFLCKQWLSFNFQRNAFVFAVLHHKITFVFDQLAHLSECHSFNQCIPRLFCIEIMRSGTTLFPPRKKTIVASIRFRYACTSVNNEQINLCACVSRKDVAIQRLDVCQNTIYIPNYKFFEYINHAH